MELRIHVHVTVIALLSCTLEVLLCWSYYFKNCLSGASSSLTGPECQQSSLRNAALNLLEQQCRQCYGCRLNLDRMEVCACYID